MDAETKISKDTLFDTGSVIDNKWVLIERTGKGGMGEVFRAHQLNLKRDVAIKVISDEILQDIDENPEEVANAMKRLQIEVQTMAQVRHPNVLQIYDYGSVRIQRKGSLKQVQYIVMEYVPGNTFRFTMSEEGFDDETELLVEWLQHYFLPVLDGFEAIHAHDIVHRDVKPENIFMDGDIPKIADFGLARSPKLKAVSNSWDVRGTMPYMAPEQFADFRKANFAADIYSLGKILYEAICGKLDPKMVPFRSAKLVEPDTDLLKAVDDIIRRATDEDGCKRYQTVSELRQAILNAINVAHLKKPKETLSDVRLPRYIRWLWAGIASVIIAVGGMTLYHLTDSIPEKSITTGSGQSDVNQTTRPIDVEKLPPTQIAADGREMKLVNSREKSLMFYSDPSLVTFHHYVEFLNEVSDSIEVMDGVVRNNGDIWIYLGDGSAASDQVIYQHSRFHLRQTEWAPKPVRRVTWLGARAYAIHYGKRLPSYDDWQVFNQQFLKVNDSIQISANGSENAKTHNMMMNNSIQNSGQGQHEGEELVFKEWLSEKQNSNTTSHVVEWFAGGTKQNVTKRYPWEGFYDVGFRTIMDIRGVIQSPDDSRATG